VHFLPFPTVQEALFNDEIEKKVSAMQQVIQLARTIREKHNIALKTPLSSLVVIADTQTLSDVQSLQSYVKEELNVLEVTLTNDEQQYGILLNARVDWPTLGKKLKKDVQIVRKALPNLTQDQLKQYMVDKRSPLAE
jgi:isoleucyl-tRNA synthetase